MIKKVYIILTIIFLVALPKGGIRIGEIPITWGYILLFLPLPFCLINLKSNIKMTPRRLAYLLTLPFLLYTCIIFIFSKVEYISNVISLFISFFLMPFSFLIVFSNIIQSKKFQDVFFRTFQICIRFVILFGLFHFIYKYITGISFEIPYLTVNADDYGLVAGKNNLRGEIYKLVSTYNNGNILGVSILIITPLYLKIEKFKLFKILLWIMLLLTLSRTVWAGVIFLMLLYSLNNFKKNYFIIIILTIFTSFILPYMVYFMGYDDSFLFDKRVGGRDRQFSVLEDLSLFGGFKSVESMGEIIYLSILGNFGFIGLLLFILYLSSPLISCYFYKIKNNVNWGIYVYLLLCMSDGAILLIPIMAFFWFISAFSLEKITYNPLL